MTRTSINNKQGRVFFGKLAFVTLAAVYFLIVVGGIVRSTGSGMGCPDWPKCFGQWVPPTEESELPENYKDTYTEKRVQKNIKLAGYLDVLGFDSKARQVKEDEMILQEADFNVFKTWTEYINRVIGAVIGLLVIGTFIASIKYFRSKPVLFWVAFAVVILTGFQGWIGSLVVSTNLLPWMVTVHMLITFFIVSGLIYLIYKSNDNMTSVARRRGVVGLIVACMVTMLIQVLFGTQVREGIDEVALSMGFTMREAWISQLDWQFYFHRSFSWVILLLNGWLVWRLIKSGEKFWSMALLSIVLISIFSGVIMAYFAVPPVMQPLHLVLGCLAFGIQYYLFLKVWNGTRTEVVSKLK